MAKTAADVAKFYQTVRGFEKCMQNLKVISARAGNCLAEIKVEQEHTNPMGTLHGGFSASLVDTVSTQALTTYENFGQRKSISADLHTTYLKSANVGDVIEIDAKTLSVGPTLASLLVEIRDKKGDVLVRGTHQVHILPE